MMNRRRFLLTSLAGALPAPLVSEAQQARKVHRIGYVSPEERGQTRGFDNFRMGLRDLGWVEGQNVVIEPRFGDPPEQLPAVMARLLDLNVDVIVAINTPPAMAAKHATKHVPIVITAGDPVEVGLVASLSRPGANVTGIAFQSSEVRAKTLQIFRELVPRSSPIGFVMLSSKNPNVELGWKRLEVAARELGAKIYRIEVDGVDDIERAFARMTQARIGGFLLSAEAVFLSRMQHIVDLAASQKLPAMYPQRGFVEAGGLMSYAPRPGDVARRLLPQYVDRILRGASPADLPVEQPQLELVINLKTAKALGLTIPPSLLARADQVIE